MNEDRDLFVANQKIGLNFLIFTGLHDEHYYEVFIR